MKETLTQFDKRVKKERATEKYNDRMRARLQKTGNPGKAHKIHDKEPQTRKVSTKVNKGEEFDKSKKKWTKKLNLALKQRRI